MALTRLEVALAERSYPIVLLDALPGPAVAELVAARAPAARRALIVTDDHVGPLYAADVAAALAAAGVAPAVHTVAPGEASKRLDVVGDVLDAAFAHRLLRADLLVALGGGVVGDLTGFAASILHRGVPFVQVPTSLLAQVDSAVGGKTGVNHPSGKNLIGTFWQPLGVVSSMAVLPTLPPREVRCGLAEALKHGLIADPALLATIRAEAAALRALAPGPTARLVATCCRIKAAVVASDERDDGPRAVLNFGHTFGHAFERQLGYGALTHGEAVGLGMLLAARLSERLGVAPLGLEAEVRRLLLDLGLPADPDGPGRPSLAALIDAARGDKKADSDGVRFVLLSGLGAATLERLSWVDVAAQLAQPSTEG